MCAGSDHPRLGRAAGGRTASPGRRRRPARRCGAGSGASPRPASTACCAMPPASPARRRLGDATVQRVVALDYRRAAPASDAVDRPRDGQGGGISLRSVQRIWAAHEPAAASHPHLQALERSRVRRPSSRTSSALRRPAQARRGAVGRREVALCGWPPARKRKVSVWHNQVALRSCVRPVDAVVA